MRITGRDRSESLVSPIVATAASSYARKPLPSPLKTWTPPLLLNLFLLILGTMLDIFSSVVLIVPLLLPMAVGYEIDPVHFGIIFLANLQLGYLTPPVGIDLFIASYRFKRPIVELFRATLPWFLLLAVSVILITYIPALSLWIPGRL